MYDIEEDPNPNPAASTDAAAAAADAGAGKDGQDGTQQPGSEAAPTPDKDETDAFTRGVESVKQPEAPAAKPEGEGDDKGGDGAKPDKDGDKPNGEGGPAKPDKETPPPNEAVEKEIKELGISNERTAQRFRDLSARAAEVEPLRARAARADEWENTVISTGASPEQFGAALGYLKAVNSGDPAQLRQAYDIMTQELSGLAQRLGLPAAGVDPLTAHPDLLEQVQKGDMDRKYAEELAGRRAAEKLHTEHQTHQQTQQQRTDAEAAALREVAAQGVEFRKDKDFERKFALIKPGVDLIQETLPPHRWRPEIQKLWDAIPKLPEITTPAPSQRTTGPLRPNSSSDSQVKKPTEENAFQFGVDVARAAGQ